MMEQKDPDYTLREEIWHSITHGFGGILAVAMLVLLVVLSAIYGDAWAVVANCIYGSSLFLLYTCSTLYHAVQKPRMKDILQRCDHIAIYYLIAGTYTPFLFVLLRGPFAWTLFGIVWGLALLGTALRVWAFGKPWADRLALILYLVMGWLIVLDTPTLWEKMELLSLTFLIAGGLAYTGGVYFYIRQRVYDHTIWHVFVLVGSIMHFFSILFSCVFLND